MPSLPWSRVRDMYTLRTFQKRDPWSPRCHDAMVPPPHRSFERFINHSLQKLKVENVLCCKSTPRRIILLIAPSIIVVSFCQLIPQRRTSNDAQFHTPHFATVSGCCESPLARLVHFQKNLLGFVVGWMRCIVDDLLLTIAQENGGR